MLKGMTNEGLMAKLRTIGPIGAVDPFFEFNTMQPSWMIEVGGSNTKTDALFVGF